MEYNENLFTDNRRLVFFVMSKMNLFNRYDLDLNAIESVGLEGLQWSTRFYSPDKGTFSNYAFRIIKRFIINEVKKQQTRRKYLPTVPLIQQLREENKYYDITDHLLCCTHDIEDKVEDIETIDEILAAVVATRDEKAQDMFALYMIGFDQGKIAKMYDISRQRISQSIMSTNKKVRSVLKLINNNLSFPKRTSYETGKEYRAAFSKYFAALNGKQFPKEEGKYISVLENVIAKQRLLNS